VGGADFSAGDDSIAETQTAQGALSSALFSRDAANVFSNSIERAHRSATTQAGMPNRRAYVS